MVATATAAVSALVGKSKPVAVDELAVTPAIDPGKLAGNAELRAAAQRNLEVSSNKLKQLAVAMWLYAEANGNNLPCDILDKDGKPLLSWRVRLLPYLEGDGEKLTPPGPSRPAPYVFLYKQFKLNEPWDSKHNRTLLAKMPLAFASPRVKVKRDGYTVYQVFSGPGALFDKGKTKYKFDNIPDGSSNTLFAVETSMAVPWTKPADIPFDKGKAVPDFGKPYGGKPLGARMDGAIRVLNLNKIRPETLKNAIIPDDGNVLGPDWE
jgi:hypothetical protein